MPFKRKHARRRPTRRHRRKPRQNAVTRVRYNNGLRSGGLPNVLQIKAKWCSGYKLMSSSGTTFTYNQQLRLNSVFDPDVSGSVSTSARGHAQLSNIYRQYRVTGCLVQIQYFSYHTDGTSSDGIVAFDSNTIVAPPATVSDFTEQGKGTIRCLTADNTKAYTFKRYYPISRVMGVSPSTVAHDDKYTSQVNGSPNDLAHFYMGIASASAIQYSLRYNMTLTFYTTYFNKREELV